MEDRNIKPINYSSIHKICSGQVVLSLATAVKELVENSIDAGATNIEVKLKEYGSGSIEVIDNGKGVKESDFQSITLKHHTSKISDFSDISHVSTFGFRGEALSSLCSLSHVEIVTCHSGSSVGSHLDFNHDGVLVKKYPTHRQVGTTVILKNLFFTLPVRHKEFHRNIRKEYAKMLQVLTAYCLISIRKRITCVNVTDKGRKNIVLSTNTCNTYKDNISCIFGSKQVDNLMQFIQHSPSEDVLEEYSLLKSNIEKFDKFKMEGYISNTIHGEGRSAADRQFYFINGRPCDLPKVSKLINEIYHSFNKIQYPFVFLNIILSEGLADVNVTPDKRQIFIPDEKLLLCIIKSSLQHMYQLQPSEMKISSASLLFQKRKSLDIIKSPEFQPSSKLKDLEECSLKRKFNLNCNPKENSPPLKSICKEKLSLNEDKHYETRMKRLEEIQDSPDSGCLSSEEMLFYTSKNYSNIESNVASPKEMELNQSLTKINFALTLPFNEETILKNASFGQTETLNLRETLQKAYRKDNHFIKSKSLKVSNESSSRASINNKNNNFCFKNSFIKMSDKKINDFKISTSNAGGTIVSNFKETQMENSNILTEEEIHVDELHLRNKKIKTISFSMNAVKQSLEAKKKISFDKSIYYRKFSSKIAPSESLNAEKELKREIKKENFLEMDVIGQFNLGFIITRLKDDLFIIDQHATDEKYNFEMLQKQTILETQQLLNPQRMNLTVVSEAILLDNLPVFEMNGFKFNVNENNTTGKKVELVSVPMSHSWKFGKEDVDEMIFMLTDNPVSMIRPSRVNLMFASRACRKSVMIGTALSYPMMKKLIVHMGEIDQPWNCPHGRPTIRHLFNLKLLHPI